MVDMQRGAISRKIGRTGKQQVTSRFLSRTRQQKTDNSVKVPGQYDQKKGNSNCSTGLGMRKLRRRKLHKVGTHIGIGKATRTIKQSVSIWFNSYVVERSSPILTVNCQPSGQDTTYLESSVSEAPKQLTNTGQE